MCLCLLICLGFGGWSVWFTSLLFLVMFTFTVVDLLTFYYSDYFVVVCFS